ncbi:putative homoserine dehydrogenase [Helianthus annuus]|nr:putative homoserine dehydrogenase [Helianthus annuus]
MSYFGANVLYPRTIIPVMQYDIPIVIRNIFNLSAPGTKNCRAPIIEAEVKQDSVAYVKGFGTIDNLALVNVEGWVFCIVFHLSICLFCDLRLRNDFIELEWLVFRVQQVPFLLLLRMLEVMSS